MALSLFVMQWLEQQQETFHPLIIAILLIFSVFILFPLYMYPRNKRDLLPPSPPKMPIIGNLHQLGTLVHRSFRDLSQIYGPLMLLHLGQSPTLVVSSAEMATEVLKNHDQIFASRPATTAAKALLYGCKDISFAPYGEYWRQLRKIFILELLSVKRVQSFKYIREEEIDVAVRKIRSSSVTGNSIDLSLILFSISNNIISRCALGMKSDDERFKKLSTEVMQLFTAFSFGDFFPSLGWMDLFTGLIGKLKKVSEELDKFYDQVIDEHLVPKEHHNEDEDKKDLVDILLDIQKSNANLARDNIKALIMDVFIGGSDTSATLLEWAMAELIKNPKEMKKAQEEVRRVVGKKCKVEEGDINHMDYLKCIIKETLRLHLPLPTLVPRLSSKSVEVAGYVIPPNTNVFINAWAIHRDSNLWDKAEDFLPERFINKSYDFKGQDFGYIPFGSGRRGCPGITFGVTTVESALANLLYWFDWKLPGDGKMEDLDMTEAFGITVSKKIHLHVVPIAYCP